MFMARLRSHAVDAQSKPDFHDTVKDDWRFKPDKTAGNKKAQVTLTIVTRHLSRANFE